MRDRRRFQAFRPCWMEEKTRRQEVKGRNAILKGIWNIAGRGV